MNILDLNLYALRYFVDSIELNSLTLASLKNRVTRPAISQAIKRMEEVVGYPLIVHSKNRLELTEEGRVFFQKAKEGLEKLAASFAQESLSDTLTIGCSASLAEFMLLPALKELAHEKIRVRVGTTARIRQLITDKEVQLGIMIDDEKTFGLNSETLKHGQFQLYSTSGQFKDCLITTEMRPEVNHLRKVFKNSRKEFRYHEFESWSVCRQAAKILKGSCVLPDFMAGLEFQRVRGISYSYPYKILAVSLDRQHSSAEAKLLEKLRSMN